MKKLRFFDSLKLVLATVACVFILNVAHADTNAIQSVIAYGKTEQSATPTPTAPVPIMTNNGELRATKNLFNKNEPAKQIGAYYGVSTAQYTTGNYWIKVTRKPGASVPSGALGVVYNIKNTPSASAKWFVNAGTEQSTYYNSGTSLNFVSADNVNYIGLLVYPANAATWSAFMNAYDVQIVPGTKTQPSIYTNGLTETIRDSAGHTATAQMLLGINDTYRDEQNINTGAITRKVGVRVLDGSEDWLISTAWGKANTNVFYYNTTDGKTWGTAAEVPATETLTFYTHFQSYSRNGVFDNDIPCAGWSGGVQAFSITIRVNKTINTVDAFKAWLADQYAAGTPVIVVYPLVTETTKNVTAQSLTTAPVRQTAGSILGMPIEVVFGDGTREWVSEIITIATTRYNEEQFEPVQNRLSDAMNAVDDVVSRTMTQAQAIDTIATTKQTRPDEGCPAKYCLLVEDEDGTPHWYPIAGANGVAHNLPAGYTELQYIESTGTQYIDTGIKITSNDIIETEFKNASSTVPGALYGVYDVSNGNNSSAFYANGTYYAYGAANAVVNTNVAIDTNWHNVIHNFVDGTLKLDNTTVEFAPFSFTNSVNSYLFARYYNGTYGYYFSGYIKRHKITRNGVVIIDLIPARRNNDNVVGMYDMADSNPATAFHAGTGEFVAGSDM